LPPKPRTMPAPRDTAHAGILHHRGTPLVGRALPDTAESGVAAEAADDARPTRHCTCGNSSPSRNPARRSGTARHRGVRSCRRSHRRCPPYETLHMRESFTTAEPARRSGNARHRGRRNRGRCPPYEMPYMRGFFDIMEPLQAPNGPGITPVAKPPQPSTRRNVRETAPPKPGQAGCPPPSADSSARPPRARPVCIRDG